MTLITVMIPTSCIMIQEPLVICLFTGKFVKDIELLAIKGLIWEMTLSKISVVKVLLKPNFPMQ